MNKFAAKEQAIVSTKISVFLSRKIFYHLSITRLNKSLGFFRVVLLKMRKSSLDVDHSNKFPTDVSKIFNTFNDKRTFVSFLSNSGLSGLQSDWTRPQSHSRLTGHCSESFYDYTKRASAIVCIQYINLINNTIPTDDCRPDVLDNDWSCYFFSEIMTVP